jgi:curved DNA-binding protein CbpA
MPNYYEILEIDHDATREAVKAAFRSRAKKCHPDLHPEEGSEWAHERMQELLRAYEVLIDDEKRAHYDKTLSRLEGRRGTSYRESLKKRQHEPRACCQLIFLDLLEGRGAVGLALYETMRASPRTFSLAAHMTVADRLDCEFLLAEEYERQHRDEDAFAHYSRIYQEDRRYRYFRHFREEILLRMRNIVIRFLWSEVSLPLALRGFSETLRDALHRRDRAFMYKKMAECFLMAGDERLARLNLLAAFQLHPGIAGVKKIVAKLSLNRRALASG